MNMAIKPANPWPGLSGRKKSDTIIDSINIPEGTKLTSNDQIANQFGKYYTQLYNLRAPPTQKVSDNRLQLIKDFLAQHGPKPISDADASSLEQPLSKEELDAVLKQVKPGKSPGPDSLTLGYYKAFIDTLYPHFLSAFNSICPDNPPP